MASYGQRYYFEKVDLITLSVSFVCRTNMVKAILDSDEGGMKFGGRKINNLRDADDFILLAESSNYLN